MTSDSFTKPKSFSNDSVVTQEKEVIDTTKEHDVDDSLSERSGGSLHSPSSTSQVFDSSSRGRSNSSDGKSDLSPVGVVEEYAATPNSVTMDQPPSELKWSDILSTPSNHPAYTPATDITSQKENLHGVALKLSVDRAKLLSRTGKRCAALLSDVASMHDELSQMILKQCPMSLETAASGTPMEEFAQHVNSCIISFAGETQKCGNRLRQDVVRPWIAFNTTSADKTMVYSEYVKRRGKCAKVRKEALKTRKKYLGAVRDAESAIQVLKQARATVRRKSTERSDTSCSVEEENEEDIQWERALKEFARRHGIIKECDSVAKALGEIQSAEGQYCQLVELENEAIANAQDAERKALDVMQMNEEERIVFMLLSSDRFLQIGREAFESMSLDLAVNPLNLNESYHKELPIPPPPSSMFLTPRRRTQSEDGPAINETRVLNLPDNIAELRDSVKSHLARQSARLKTLKAISSFNEGLAAAIDNFASGLHARLEIEGYTGKMDGKNSSPLAVILHKNEGQEVLKQWNKVIQCLLSYASNASQLANHIKRGNTELYNILLPAKRELKTLHESEESRWKSVCDTAKGESQAKLKQKQYSTDLQKAQTRLALTDETGSGDNVLEQQPTQEEYQKKSTFMGQSMKDIKMNSQMNKAMGKMFSVLPGGGEDVMNKMLKPEQRKAIMEKNLDEAKKKSMKATESLSAATAAKSQSILMYENETEIALHKFRTNERYVWAQMQKSLENSVISVKTFRDSQRAKMPIADDIASNTKAAVLYDISKWVKSTKIEVEDYHKRYAAEFKDEDNYNGSGFFLKLILEHSTDIKELVNLVVNDNDDDFGIGVEIEYDDPDNTIVPLSIVPEDQFIKDMDVIFSKTLKNVSIESYYSAGWSEETPLYRPWLEKKGSFDVFVGEWETSEQGFKHEWSGETFPQRRTIKFKFKRTTHLYIGPPVAGVTQTQYCRLEGNDRCITMMTAEMDGIPYSDVFAVEVRWSARRQGTNDITIDAGMHVRFIKSSMFAKQIKSGTLTETKPIHLSLFDAIKVAVASDDNDDIDVIENEEQPTVKTQAISVKEQIQEKNPHVSPLKTCIKFLSSTFWSLPKEYKAFSGVIFFGTIWIWSRRSPNNDQYKLDALNIKFDQLSNELAEVKALLNTIVHLMNEQGQQIRGDEL